MESLSRGLHQAVLIGVASDPCFLPPCGNSETRKKSPAPRLAALGGQVGWTSRLRAILTPCLGTGDLWSGVGVGTESLILGSPMQLTRYLLCSTPLGH